MGRARKGDSKNLHLSTRRKSKKRQGKNLLEYRKAKRAGTWIPREERAPPVEVPSSADVLENLPLVASCVVVSPLNGTAPEVDTDVQIDSFPLEPRESNNGSMSMSATHDDLTNVAPVMIAVPTEEESMEEEPEFALEGRRIVDIAYFLRALQDISGVHEPLECSLGDMKVTAETHTGFTSSFRLECEFCDTVARISTEDPARLHTTSINTAAVGGVVQTMGGSLTQLQALMSAMQVKCMGSRQWKKQIKELLKDGQDTLMTEMMDAGREERQLARIAGRVGVDGVAIIPVVTDTSWSNRFYRLKIGMANYTTGVSAILGYHTRRLLYIGVLHKYCTVCAVHARVSADSLVPPHKCAKRWTNVAALLDHASVGEGFKLSVAMHQLKYGQLIGDLDGSVRRMLLEIQPYGAEFLITPVESISVLLRGYTTSLSRLTTDNNAAIKPLRTILRKNLRRLRVGVISAVKRRKVQRTPTVMNIQQLHEDISNVPAHVFGDHRHCAALLCADKAGSEPVVEMLQSALYVAVQQAARMLAQQAHKLILDIECNISEKYNAFLVDVLFNSKVLAQGAMERTNVKGNKSKEKQVDDDDDEREQECQVSSHVG